MMEQQGGIGNDPATLIQNAFLDFDTSLTTHDVTQELRNIAGYNEMEFHDEGSFDVKYKHTLLVLWCLNDLVFC